MYKEILISALKETVFMVGYSTIFAVIIGFILAIVLVVTDDKGLKPNKFIYGILDLFINILRSFPFIILMIAIIPLTKLLVGKSIGTVAAIVPLTIGAAPFAARVLESALKEVEPGLIEAAKSFGATNTQILFRVMVKEAFPSIIRGIILTIINLIGYSAMAGAVGGGGLGHVAISYGYNRFNTEVMIYTVIVLIILVQIIQSFGNLVYKNLNK
ncbi:ABC transporter permease [Clostridium sp. MSJ-11]|uniref:ABC transporter permease n=1 Tax=Clostridium mobile TaxID=2841512 RepID=A0ABS6EDL4_9CLOT|nr:methionine ABC transporter permease [Clostridium mobile]MBU5482872.1 ABC transporter permease [Clostridium mobile]